MADNKKLWFCGRDGLDGGAWADLWTIKQVREYFKGSNIQSHLPKSFKTLRVKVCFGVGEDDSRLYSWNEKQPGFQNGDLQGHIGTCVEVDGKVVFNDLRPDDSDLDNDEDHSDCDECGSDLSEA